MVLSKAFTVDHGQQNSAKIYFESKYFLSAFFVQFNRIDISTDEYFEFQ